MLAAGLVAAAAPAYAKPLDQLIPGLFGGTLNTTINQTFTDTSQQQPIIVNRFRNLPSELSVARSQVPIPSSSGAFSYAWDPELDTFMRFEQSLGSLFAERAQTLGRGRFTVGVSYQHADFTTLDGVPLGHVRSSQPAFTQAYLAKLPPPDRAIFGDDVIDTRLALSFSYDLFYLTAAYGVTDNIDVSLALTINRAALSGNALAMTLDPAGSGQGTVGVFTAKQQGVIVDGTGPVCSLPYRCAADSFNGTATGTGDIFVRGKWHIADTSYADFAVSGLLTIPTGNADDFLGYYYPTFTPTLIISKNFGRVSPHANIGYAIRSTKDVPQFQWITGADVIGARWLTFFGDFLGYEDTRGGNVIQAAVGGKVNPIGGLVMSAGFQFPVNRNGLRADVIYTGQVEYNF